MAKVMISYPPGRTFQRGEDRCQIDIDSSVCNCSRACNDLGYVSACLKRSNHITFIKDYQGEKLKLDDFIQDIRIFNPDIIFLSTTNGSIYSDLEIIKEIKKEKNDTIIILKGALFFNPEESLFKTLDLSDIDYLIGGQVEFIIENLVNAHLNDKSQLKNIEGISYKKDGKWISQYIKNFNGNLDDLPFPDRSLMNNKLYINPETNRPMALITTSLGCCFSCSYCLSPVIAGKNVRFRSAENIFNEVKECIEKYNIKDFFFKSDTFTVNKQQVIDLCRLIIDSGLNKKINWVATARVDTIDDNLIKIMKESGCTLLAIGFESGSQESLDKMNKKTTIEQNIYASKLCKKYGIKILGYFLVGFPWENETHLKQTQNLIFKLDPDYIEISIVVPFYKTPIYEEIYKKEHINADNVAGHDSYNNVDTGCSQLSAEKLKEFKKRTILSFYLRPIYIIKCLLSIKSFAVLKNYIFYGFRMIKNLIIGYNSKG